MANHIILGSVLSLALVLSPHPAFSTATKPADKEKTASSKLRRKSKSSKIIKSSSRSRFKQKAKTISSNASPVSSARVAGCEDPPLIQVIPQRDGHFIVESRKSRKTRGHLSGPASKLDRREVVPASVLGHNKFELPNFRDLILTRSKTYCGAPYARGASLATGSATDCSGFVQYIYHGFKIDLPRTSAEQAQVGKVVTYRMDFSKMVPGDLLFFRRGTRSIGHAGIYLGEGKMIHASNHRNGVTISDLRQPYYQDTFVVAKRVFEVAYPDW